MRRLLQILVVAAAATTAWADTIPEKKQKNPGRADVAPIVPGMTCPTPGVPPAAGAAAERPAAENPARANETPSAVPAAPRPRPDLPCGKPK